ncbi:ABC transporter ATP-binding protein [Metamycoplasma cloacale]|uniref:Chromosome partition protein Smc n=1 Tax=Metamycoplasma cloacale TaxID=92401 RepID=A0A2Z4LMT8_9BACT|nr:AAA family ATPase [Metamycoplasma cloacale]AWX42557.1 ABC transporter ATP-binding protein [Metamycoplasma cloacale]VEU79754.1 ABC transporter ATP-binding protein [Metamycoplasma cloacale]
MKLIQVEAHGFKSFADKVTLKLDGGVCAIIGPNGSGKSNINDAIRWVLGESSSKALRGDNMQDVIFAGSKTEKEMDFAQVTLTFDNRENPISIPHDFFTISRVIHRGKGENEYYINGEPATKKEIREISMESGISKSSLAIIGQGTISDIAEATPERRREIFEEASGTSMYRARKIEAQKKLERTEIALSELTSVINELERRRNPLVKQAEKAKIYLEKSEQLKEVEISVLVRDTIDYSHRLEQLKEEAIAYETEKDELNSKNKFYDNIIQQKALIIEDLRKQVESLSREHKDISEKITNLEIRSVKEQAQREMIIKGSVQTTTKEQIEALKLSLNELNQKISTYRGFIQEREKTIENLNVKITNRFSLINQCKTNLELEQGKLNKVKSRIDVIREVNDKKATYAKGTKNIVENSTLFKGYKALVSQLIEVEDQYIKAIESILAGAAQHIVVDTSETAVDAINFLKKNNGGKATFIPLSTIKPKFINEQHIVVAQTQRGFLGLASELVKTAREYDVLRKFLLGNILVCDTIESANKLSKLLENRYMVVTLDGDIIRAGGVMTGGQANQQSNVFGMEREIATLEQLVPVLDDNIIKLKEALVKLQQEQDSDSAYSANFVLEKATLQHQLNNCLNEFDDLNQRYNQLSTEKLELEENIDFKSSIAKLISEQSELQVKLKSEELLLKNASIEFQELTMKKNENSILLTRLLEENQSKISERAKAESIIETAKKRLTEQYGMLIETAQQYYNPEIEIDTARKLVSNLKQDIRELGHVNVEAIQELAEVQQRYDTLVEQQQEISTAKATIEEAIEEMDKIIVQKITETVDLVNHEFNEVFRKMFGGGKAEIKYTEPDNLLDSGIDVIAQPPGKAIKNLKLFSGGEKALIAISLLFSILKAKPLPLCILDEVEAALDEANVIRFAEFLQHLKKETQFVVITHRQGTMERVDKLYGATMQKRGVTTFFSVNLADAKRLVDEKGNAIQ